MAKHIREHASSNMGHAFISFLLKKTKVKTLADFEEWILEMQDELLEATDNLYLTKYYLDRLKASFKSSPLYVEMERRVGGNVGHLMANPTASAKMTLLIYGVYHEQFISFLRNSEMPVSVLLDESTLHNVNYIMILLQGVYRSRPKIWFYQVLHNVDGSGKGLFNALKQQWQVDDLEEYFRTHLVGVTTDGASSMGQRGEKALLHFLEEFAQNPLTGTHCASHKLQLAGSWSIKTELFFIHIEEVATRVHTFYEGKAYKRLEHLRATARELATYLYKSPRIMPVRWVNSERKTIRNLKRNWKTLVIDLNAICGGDGHFDAPTRQQACSLVHELSTRRFILNLHFALDILDTLSVWSLKLQKSSDVLIDKNRQRDEILTQLRVMGNDDGPELSLFKSGAICYGQTPGWVMTQNGIPQVVMTYDKPRSKCVTEEEFDRAEYVEYHDFPLLPRTAGSSDLYLPKLSDIRKSTIDSIIDKINLYFPHKKLLEGLSILDPFELPPDPSMHFSYWTSTSPNMKELAMILKFGPNFQAGQLSQSDSDYIEAVVNGWQRLLGQFADVPSFQDDRKLSADKFWGKYLTLPGFEIDPDLRSLIEHCLSLPSGSHSVESAFSVLKRLIGDDKTGFNLKSINALMFSSLNGPHPRNFKPRKFTEKHVLGHVRVDDPTVKPRTHPQDEDDDQKGTLFDDTQF